MAQNFVVVMMTQAGLLVVYKISSEVAVGTAVLGIMMDYLFIELLMDCLFVELHWCSPHVFSDPINRYCVRLITIAIGLHQCSPINIVINRNKLHQQQQQQH